MTFVNRIYLASGVLAVSMCVAKLAAGQNSEPAKVVDWTKLEPHLIDEAFDWIDAIHLQSSVLDKPDSIYLPREADAERLQRRIQRAAETDADKEVYSAVMLYGFTVQLCRISSKPEQCSWQHLSELEDEATTAVKEIRRKYRASVQSK